MKTFIDSAWEAFLKGEQFYKSSNIEKYSRRETTKAMAALLDKITQL